jgi:hypothetical protein
MRRMARGLVGFDNAIHVANAGMPSSVTRNMMMASKTTE